MITLLAVPKTPEEKGEIDARSVYVGNVSKAINQFEIRSIIYEHVLFNHSCRGMSDKVLMIVLL